MTPQQAAEWAAFESAGDPRWSFGLAEIDGKDWLIGRRGDLSFPMYEIQGVSDPREAFHAFLKSPQWEIVKWLCGEPQRKFRRARERMEKLREL